MRNAAIGPNGDIWLAIKSRVPRVQVDSQSTHPGAFSAPIDEIDSGTGESPAPD